MQTQPVGQQPGKPALLSGLVIGIILGVIHSIITITMAQISVNGDHSSAVTVSLQLLIPLIWIIGLLVAGTWSSKETGMIGTGTLAGLFAGIFGSIIAGFGQIIATAITTQNVYQASSMVLFTGYTAIFFVMVLAIGAGAGVGAIGGLIGQSISKVRPVPTPQPVPVYAQPIMPYPYTMPQPMTVPVPQPMAMPQTPQPQQRDVPPFPEQ